jgi:hypothetical protein
MKAFNHNFTEPLTEDNIHEMNGFILAMRSFQKELAEMTEWKPEKRMVDAVVLLDKISATIDEFNPLMEAAKKQLTEIHNF